MPYEEAAAPALAADLEALPRVCAPAWRAAACCSASASGRTAFPLDPVPRVIEAEDWHAR